MQERLAMLRQMEDKEKADIKLENAIGYAKRLEEIIQAVEVDTNTRLIINSLVGTAKQQFDMYNI